MTTLTSRLKDANYFLAERWWFLSRSTLRSRHPRAQNKEGDEDRKLNERGSIMGHVYASGQCVKVAFVSWDSMVVPTAFAGCRAQIRARYPQELYRYLLRNRVVHPACRAPLPGRQPTTE